MKNTICVDAGSVYCPCHLAETKDCILCSHLKGKKLCDCNWQGVCIYNNFMKNKEHMNEQREDILCEIKKHVELEKDVHLLEIKIPPELGIELIHPGSYVLLRGETRNEDKFNMPISVMNVNLKENLLTIIVESIGPKTKYLLQNKKVFVKGPYRNGIFGLKELKMIKEKKVILIARGPSQVTLINVVNQLSKNKNKTKIFIDNMGIKISLIEELLKNKEDVDIHYIDLEKQKDLLKEELKLINLVYSAGSNFFNKKILDLVDEIDENIPFVMTNNNLICCGEGLCGACIVKIKGEKVRTCKTQVEPRVYLKEALK